MTLRSTILTFRMHRFEMTVIVAAAIASVLVSAVVVGWLSSVGYELCLTDDSVSLTSLCQGSLNLWLVRIARLSTTLVPIFPFVAGLLIGTPLIARELESGTARLAWSLAPSRVRWFVQRAIPAIVLVGVAALVIGLTADRLFHTLQPTIDLDHSFVGFRGRGLLVAVEAVLVASIAIALGSILGRAVPTVVLALILAGGIGLAVDKVETQLLTNEALVKADFTFDGGDLYLDNRFRLPDGQIVTYSELAALHPEINEQGFQPELYPNVALYIPGSRYHDIELREAVVLIGISGLFMALATLTVTRRRPR